jgi:hypothetical protein
MQVVDTASVMAAIVHRRKIIPMSEADNDYLRRGVVAATLSTLIGR